MNVTITAYNPSGFYYPLMTCKSCGANWFMSKNHEGHTKLEIKWLKLGKYCKRCRLSYPYHTNYRF